MRVTKSPKPFRASRIGGISFEVCWRKNLHQDTNYLLELSEDSKDTWFSEKVRWHIRGFPRLRGEPGVDLVAR